MVSDREELTPVSIQVTGNLWRALACAARRRARLEMVSRITVCIRPMIRY